MCTFSATAFTSPLLPLSLLLGFVVLGLVLWKRSLGLGQRGIPVAPPSFQPPPHEPSAIEVLRERFVRGEVDASTFERQLTVLLEHTRSPDGSLPARCSASLSVSRLA
jgi:hypothetical protein